MNVEMIELKSVEQVTTTEEAFEVLALSFDDLDLVGGGTSLGSLV